MVEVMTQARRETEGQEEVPGEKQRGPLETGSFSKVRNGVHIPTFGMLTYKPRKFKPFLL